MKKLNLLIMSLIICIVGSVATAYNTIAPPTLTATPLPIMTPTSIPTEHSLITTTGAFFALSVADVNASADWYSEKLDRKPDRKSRELFAHRSTGFYLAADP